MVVRTGPVLTRPALLGWAAVLSGLAFAEFLVLIWVATTLSLAVLWVGLPLFVSALLLTRSMADGRRRWAGEEMGVAIGRDYRVLPATGWPARFGVAITDPATWRDVRWLAVDCTVGLTLLLVPVLLVAGGVLGIALPVIWATLPDSAALDFPFGLRVTGVASALYIGVPNGLIYLAAGWWLAPAVLRWYTALTVALLRPDERARLSHRVEHLSRAREHTAGERVSELRRIERDLHDGTQAHLVALGMNLGLVESMVGDDPRARDLLAQARQHNAQAIAELRALIRGIRPPVLSDRGLAGAVQSLAMRLPLEIEVDLDIDGRLPETVESAAYFSISEAMTNIVKHADAQRGWVRGQWTGGRLVVEVADDGNGEARIVEGSGLAGIRDRLHALDGVLSVSSRPGVGTTVQFDLPCQRTAGVD